MTDLERAEAVEELRRWEGEEPDDEEAMRNLGDALDSAESYLLGAGVKASSDPLRNMARRKLAVYFYEVRGPSNQNGYPALPPDLNHLVLNLRY